MLIYFQSMNIVFIKYLSVFHYLQSTMGDNCYFCIYTPIYFNTAEEYQYV